MKEKKGFMGHSGINWDGWYGNSLNKRNDHIDLNEPNTDANDKHGRP